MPSAKCTKTKGHDYKRAERRVYSGAESDRKQKRSAENNKKKRHFITSIAIFVRIL